MQRHSDVELVLHAIADPSRRAIVERLSAGPAAVSELARPMPITLAAVVQHVQVLERAGVVRSAKLGRVRTCQLDPAALTVVERWIADRKALWNRRLDRLDRVLDER